MLKSSNVARQQVAAKGVKYKLSTRDRKLVSDGWIKTVRGVFLSEYHSGVPKGRPEVSEMRIDVEFRRSEK